jgi:ketosteroid isomerase-like protein
MRKAAVVSLTAATILSLGAGAAFAAGPTDTGKQTVAANAAHVSSDTQLSKANAKLLNGYYNAFLKGDVNAAAQYVSADFVGHVPGKGANAGEYWSQDGFKKYTSNILAHTGGRYDVKVPVVSANGADVITREKITANRADNPHKIFSLPVTMHFRFKAGKISEVWTLPEDQRLFDKYWAPLADGSKAPTGKPLSKDTNVINVGEATSEKTLGLIKHLYNDFWHGDIADIRSKFSDNVSVNIVGKSAMSGQYHGWDGYMQFRTNLMKMVGSKYKLEADTYSASANDAWVKEYIRMDRKWDKSFDTVYVMMHFQFKDGKIVHIDDFPVDTYAWEKFYTPPQH